MVFNVFKIKDAPRKNKHGFYLTAMHKKHDSAPRHTINAQLLAYRVTGKFHSRERRERGTIDPSIMEFRSTSLAGQINVIFFNF
tara:strand:+ start:2371 stop:2622 length:252 start_codon:yes stop_codon:yes gene_type:complete